MQACLSMLNLRLHGKSEKLDLLDRMQLAQNDLLRLFNEVQGYAAPLRLEHCRCNLADVWRAAWASLASAPRHGSARLVEEVGGLDLCTFVSPFHLEQVFRNLLENALSAGRDPVEIVIRCAGTSVEGRPGIEIAVRDNGPGFELEGRQKAFDPFYTTKVRGTGLGLAICKRIVEGHGGRIDIGEGEETGGVVLIVLPRRTT
jgi:signal transduction histidine kinase